MSLLLSGHLSAKLRREEQVLRAICQALIRSTLDYFDDSELARSPIVSPNRALHLSSSCGSRGLLLPSGSQGDVTARGKEKGTNIFGSSRFRVGNFRPR